MKPYASYKPSGVPWLGDVPGHWDVLSLRHAMDGLAMNGLFKKSEEFGRGTPLVNVSDLFQESFAVDVDSLERVVCTPEEVEKYAVQVGDLFLVRSSLKLEGIAQFAVARVVKEPTVFECHIVRIRPDLQLTCPHFLSYYLNAPFARQSLVSRSKTTTMTTIDQNEALSTPMLLPSLDEQRAIAAYLDVEAARIDTLIREKNELLGLLKEWRQSVIAEAVTKGLDKTAVMKPSGVAWLGEVPSHWEVKQTRFVMTCNDDVLPEHTSPEQPLDYVEISDVDEMSGIKGFETVRFVDAPSRARRLVVDGDVIVSTVRTYLRAVAAISNPTPDTVVSTGFAVLRPRSIDSRFVRYAILCDGFISEVIARSKGISYPAINATDLVRIAVPLPPPGEQQAIALYLDTETVRIDDLIAHTNEEITLLKELRAATIADAVLGRVDVRTAPKQ